MLQRAKNTLTHAMVVGLALTMGACLSREESAQPPNAIPFATVLPFSGARAASGANLELAMRFVADQVNRSEGGGVAGRPLYPLVSDSHSDIERGTANARKLINEDHAPIFIGAEEPEITYGIANDVKAAGAVHLMPGLTSPRFHDPSTKAAWFRLAPAGEYLACALAKRMIADGVTRATTVVTSDDYSGSFATSFGTVFREKGGQLQPSIKVLPGTTAYGAILSALARTGVSAAVLVTTPTVAAQIIQEWAVGDRTQRWYLAPMLKDPEFLRNIPPRALDSAVGVSADLEQESAAFNAFFAAGTGEPPLDAAAYYYDAAAMMSLTLVAAYANLGAMPSAAQFKTYMMTTAAAPGTIVRFDELALGLQLAAAGQDIQYQGAAGSYVINASGDSVDTAAALWTIDGYDFITVGHDACVASEIAYNL